MGEVRANLSRSGNLATFVGTAAAAAKASFKQTAAINQDKRSTERPMEKVLESKNP